MGTPSAALVDIGCADSPLFCLPGAGPSPSPSTLLKEVLLQHAENEILISLLQGTMHTIHEALDQYGPHGVAVSFNGGKDCTILLFLYMAALEDYHQSHPDVSQRPVKVLYITSDDPFPAIDLFVDVFSDLLGVDLMKILGQMKPALERFLDSNKTIRAVLIGTRRTDPHADNLTRFDATDKEWPAMMRVHPILDWGYKDIWAAIIALRIPYCGLYKHGYTSLGSVNDTLPNPLLKCSSVPGGYMHAVCLEDGLKERCGRELK
ncbi:hypothetical protein BASA82_000703 [Batrachochytrium salamandrivorans]|uniref:FAD synthase n=1 Tax=Batrachochytrium salamandrivorans TaxID=1357716 RepID=A0ABQ8FA07_9FUNG|nr:hypothetical protein BASA62_005836 [Batrachochytrium salamandrivorans]KAH6594707.1 hypothetical protein BASA50_006383 [Batrachochytrium salamandrivorans]KAH9262254.1 hypothetical protein BASA82_000703 [Batrachochytrium salamandrivorans]